MLTTNRPIRGKEGKIETLTTKQSMIITQMGSDPRVPRSAMGYLADLSQGSPAIIAARLSLLSRYVPELVEQFRTGQRVEVEVVTVGPWETRKFDGIIVNGLYYEKGAARTSADGTVRQAYWRARRAIRNSSYSLDDAPLGQYAENGKTIYLHDLKESDK